MNMVIMIVVIIIGIGIFFLQRQNHENRINEYIESMGGQVINIEHKTFSIGPFFVVGKGRNVYRFEYEIGSQTKEGWVKFGSLFGPDWRL